MDETPAPRTFTDHFAIIKPGLDGDYGITEVDKQMHMSMWQATERSRRETDTERRGELEELLRTVELMKQQGIS